MPPRRPRANARGSASAAKRRSPRSEYRDATPDNIYDDMVAEASAADARMNTLTPDRPFKRRRTARRVSTPDRFRGSASPTYQASSPAPATIEKLKPQTIEASDSDESDFDFEDVDLDHVLGDPDSTVEIDEIVDISVPAAAPQTPQKRAVPRRKPASGAEKAFRLLVHKLHVLTLISHCVFVNSWCNDKIAHIRLRKVLDKDALSWLKLDAGKSQFEHNRWFMRGLEHAVELFKASFEVNTSGLHKAQWSTDNVEIDAEDFDQVLDREEFVAASKSMSGSQDMGNQLFCAMLRSINVRARLVCSLQPLPFRPSIAKDTMPQNLNSGAHAGHSTESPLKSGKVDPNANSPDADMSAKRAKRKLGQPVFPSTVGKKQKPPASKVQNVRKLSYPVFWVEAFNVAHQKWVAVDPIVTSTVNKPGKLEPPRSYQPNQLTYVIAFEGDGVARDVTRRYAKAFNAKTLRQRLESTENGAKWWKKVLRYLRRQGPKLDREQVEDAELAAKEGQEGMPSNIQDFRDHPHYALERHLRRHEVLFPRKEIGTVNAGTTQKPKMETVFRRSHVLACRSADRWYRLGREIKSGELPLKHVTVKSRQQDTGDDGDGETKTSALYAIHQTEIYIPPPVVNGRVPRNAYGNLDVYVPSMVPRDGTHIRHEYARQAAQILRVDCVDAVTGFRFKGRHGTAVIEGVVVPSEFSEAITTVIEGIEFGHVQDANRKRSLIALQLWHRFCKGLHIRSRVREYGQADDSKAEQGSEEHNDVTAESCGSDSSMSDDDLPTAGMFSISELNALTAKSKKKKSKRKLTSDDDLSDGEWAMTTNADADDEQDFQTITDDDELGGGFLPQDPTDIKERHGSFPRDSTGLCEGGGFMMESDTESEGHPNKPGTLVSNSITNEAVDDTAGGFIVDDTAGGFIVDDTAAGFIVDESTGKDIVMHDTAHHVQAKQDENHVGTSELDHEGDRAHTANCDQYESAAEFEVLQIVDHASGDTQSNTNPEVMKPAKPLTTSKDSEIAEDRTGTAGMDHLAVQEAVPERLPSELDSKPNGTRRSSSVSDHGSLLSQDPEDEDAEPDWLESD